MRAGPLARYSLLAVQVAAWRGAFRVLRLSSMRSWIIYADSTAANQIIPHVASRDSLRGFPGTAPRKRPLS